MTRFRGIVAIVCLVVAWLLPNYSYAQFDAASMQRGQRVGSGMEGGMNGGMNGMGVPGMGDTNAMGEGDQTTTDTTATEEKRERRPLESYYFGDTVRALIIGSGP